MDMIIKAAAIAVICSAAAAVIKNRAPEFVPFIQIASVIATVFLLNQTVQNLVDYFSGFFSSAFPDTGSVMLILKALGIAVTGKFGAELCRDSGNSALAFTLETAAKAAILSMSLPMLKSLAAVTAGLLKG